MDGSDGFFGYYASCEKAALLRFHLSRFHQHLSFSLARSKIPQAVRNQNQDLLAADVIHPGSSIIRTSHASLTLFINAKEEILDSIVDRPKETTGGYENIVDLGC